MDASLCSGQKMLILEKVLNRKVYFLVIRLEGESTTGKYLNICWNSMAAIRACIFIYHFYKNLS